jgi:toxin ParE1/3/4
VVIVWSKPVREDLHLIHQYIAHDRKRDASRVVPDITEKVEGVREIALYSCRVLYELIGETVYIHGVILRRRDFKPEDIQR